MGLGTSDPARAQANLLARNALLNGAIRERARALGLAVVEVDGSLSLAATEALVAARFAVPLAAGPRAGDGEARRRIRRRENVATQTNSVAYLRDLGVTDLDAAPPMALGCECLTLGCTAALRVSPGAFGAVLARPGRYVVAAGHESESETVVGSAGDAQVVEIGGVA